MGYDNPQRGSAGTVIGIVAVIAVLLIGGLVVLGVGALFFLRTSARQTEVVARMEAKRAVVELERDVRLAVQLKVDSRCLAHHVVAVHAICSERDVEEVRISTLEVPSSATNDESASTTETAEFPSQ